ncbi:hypothetical protein N431DRAFT_361945 [Stipitochalara longipes BDJ]|nr:hypothetical protein N431DRAFT_361945 [Stipitochalara longipes BDJ]
MTDTSSYHKLAVKQDDLTPFDSPQRDKFYTASVLVKSEELEIKSEVKPENIPGFASEAGSSGCQSQIHEVDKLNQVEPETPKQPRRKPAKTAREYHRRKQEDFSGGVRKVRKVIRKINPEKLLNSLSHHDLVSAYNAGPSNGVAPIITTSTKKDFMQQILTKCPEADLQKFRTELNILDEESRSFGLKRMEMRNGMWKLKGMKSLIYHYQLKGAAWMVGKELSIEGPYGGILADAMGLGKTVQTITTMIANPPTPELIGKNQKTTLIIAHRSLLQQWKTELRTHAKVGKILTFNPADEDNNSFRWISDNDVVLATYNAVQMSFPELDQQIMTELKQKARAEERSMAEVLEEWVARKKKTSGYLHKIHWYRIILDEAHYIKNYSAKTTPAVLALKGHHRWALSGTPAQNGPEDYYPLFCFIRDPQISKMTFKQYQAAFCRSQKIRALGLAVAKVTMRRTLEDEFLGKKLVDLPPPHTQDIPIKASDPERILQCWFGSLLEDLSKMELEDDDPRKDLSYMFPQITRFRQLTASPDLIEEAIILASSLEDFEDLQRQLSNLEPLEKPIELLSILQDRIKIWIAQKKALSLVAPKRQKKKHCLLCEHDTMEDLRAVPKCGHIFCESCITNAIAEEIKYDEEVTNCPECRSPFDPDKLRKCQIITAAVKKRSKGLKSAKYAKSAKSGKKGRDALNFRPSPAEASDWLKRLDKGRMQILPTAKLMKIMDLIRRWKVEYPKQKVTLFTQWNQFAIMIGTMLQKERIQFVYITGGMTSKQRTRAIKKFHEDAKIHIMILGLKAGGVGLNLTCANRGILVDRWWNKAAEDQAHGRIYRIGQKKPTLFVTLVVKDTIDEGVVKLQEEKEKNIGSIMQGLTKEQQARLRSCGWTEAKGEGVEEKYNDNNEYMEDIEVEIEDDDDEFMPDEGEDDERDDDKSDSDDDSDEDD